MARKSKGGPKSNGTTRAKAFTLKDSSDKFKPIKGRSKAQGSNKVAIGQYATGKRVARPLFK